MSTTEKLTEMLHDKTGATGAELEQMVHAAGALMAACLDNEEALEYFGRRYREAGNG